MGLEVAGLSGSYTRPWVFGLDIRNLRDLREALITPYGQQGRRYVYGKTHHCLILAPTAGVIRSLGTHGSLSSISLQVGAQAGPALALLNPYHLVVYDQTSLSFVIRPYDPAQHVYQTIAGRSGWVSSPLDLRAQVGATARVYIQTDMARGVRNIGAFRFGFQADIFPQSLPLLATRPDLANRRLYLSATLSLITGSRW
jgi:hypothetical protein